MKKPSRRAFTIVELVIVIAVISILAAVLIPTFSSIIKSANKSADEQELASVNIQLAIADGIYSEADLYKVITRLSPRSAEYGYHYWYDINANTVVLKTYEEIAALNVREARNILKIEHAMPVTLARASFSRAGNAGFAENEKNNFRKFESFFLLDNGGSVIGDALNALSTGADVAKKVEALTKVKETSANKAMADALIEKLSTVAIIGNDLTFVLNPDRVERIYFAPGIETIASSEYAYIAKAENIIDDIIIPDTVKVIKENALFFDVKDQVTVRTSFDSAEKIAEVFKANSTNAVIASTSEDTYTVDGGLLKDASGQSVSSLEYGNPVESFEIVIPDDTDDYKSVLNNLYVAYNYTGTIQLGVDSFKGVNGDTVSSETVTWMSDNEHVVVNENDGTISINGLPELEECTAKITATAVAGGATAYVQINVVRVAGYSVKLNETALSLLTPYAADYKNDTPKSYAITVTPTYNIDDVNITPPFSATVTASGDEFSYDSETGTLSMVLDSNGRPTFSIKEGESARTLKTTLTVAAAGMTNTYDIVFTDKSESPLEVALPNVNDYLYFIGNKNAIKLESLFKVKDGHSLLGDVSVEVVDIVNSGEEDSIVEVTLSDTTGLGKTFKLPEAFVGPVEIRVTAHGMTTSLYANVVDATNVTSYSELKNQNSVLLGDITMSSGSSYYLSDATLYGNGFTFDVRDGAYTGTGYGSSNYLVGLSNANLDNIKIVGKVYSSYGVTASADYNRATVLTSGDCRITNSYISNCAAPVRVHDGETLIENSTLKGGSYANLDIRNGNITVRNLTTINQANLNDKADDGSTVIGLGIVVYYEQVLTTTTLTVEGTLTQYNYISKKQAENFADSRAELFVSAAFGNDYSQYQFTDASGDKWLHIGIISMTLNGAFGKDNLNNGSNPDGYVSFVASEVGYEGYVWNVIPNADAIAFVPDEWKPTTQAPVAPDYSFEYPKEEGDKNFVAKENGSNDWCYYEDGKIFISMDYGESFEFDPAILTATKYGYTLSYTVSINGVDYTGKKIIFNANGDYTIEYTYTDTYNYKLVGDVVQSGEETYTKKIAINVVVADPAANHAEFSFNGTAGNKVEIGNKTYISANVNATSTSWGSVTVDGETVYYPIVDAYKKYTFSLFSGSGYQAFFPVFKNVITITDYQDSGNGDAVTYNDSTTTKPAGLTVVKGYEGYQSYTDDSNFVVNDTKLGLTGASKVFKWAAGSDAASEPDNYKTGSSNSSKIFSYASPEKLNRSGNHYRIVQYSYTDNAGSTFYYYVGYLLKM